MKHLARHAAPNYFLSCTYAGGNQPSLPSFFRPYHQPCPSWPNTVISLPGCKGSICVSSESGGSKVAKATTTGMLSSPTSGEFRTIAESTPAVTASPEFGSATIAPEFMVGDPM